ncbi:MAG: tRNA-dihydrouridine synthase [Elusimicrobia bacterium]|nr:tRNA-dihydrouridine synthase [Elusimicrobiota bacterium]
MIQIGNKKINTNIFLAPLSASSDLAFRLIAREQGAKFCFFEMIDSNSLVHVSPRSERILQTCPEDQPIAAQLLGADPEIMLKAAEIILSRAPITFLDINAACPARKVYKKGAGACFFNDPAPLVRVIERLSSYLPIPVTVKMRVGLNQVDIPKAVQFAKCCESSGASALFVHGRSQSQENYGPVNYEAIRAIKESVGIPVFGSGNILNPPLAKKMFDQTGCDGILIAKGSFGNPSIYRDIETYLETGTWQPAIELQGKLEFLKKHLLLVQQIKGHCAISSIGELGKICLWYLKGFTEASRMRAQIFKSQSYPELLAQIESILENR